MPQAPRQKCFATLSYGAKGWNKERCIAARIEATPNGLDIRYVVTSLNGTAKHLYETVYCGRGRCENFIKWHKAQLASDRTSCRDPKANQFRLILHTAAYWLMLTARNAIAKRLPLAVAEFATLRLRLIKIAARVIEGTARIRVHLPTACPDRAVLPPTRRPALRSRTVSDAALSPRSRPPSLNLQPVKTQSQLAAFTPSECYPYCLTKITPPASN